MFLFANYNESRTITSITVGASEPSSFALKVTNTVTDNKINIAGTEIEFNKFLKNLKSFTIGINGTITFKSGQSLSTLDDSLVTLDTSIPMAYTRANTIVNFGSL